MKYTDKYTITSLYWDRIWIYFEIKADGQNPPDSFSPCIINEAGNYKAYLRKENPGIYKLNITNPGNCKMLPVGIYYVSYDSDKSERAYIDYSSPEHINARSENKHFVYFHAEREYRIQFKDRGGFKFRAADNIRTDIRIIYRLRTPFVRKRHEIAKVVLRTVYNTFYYIYNEAPFSHPKKDSILLFNDQSEEIASNMEALKEALIKNGYKPEESFRAITTKHYGVLHWLKTLRKIARAKYIFMDDHCQTTDWLPIKGAVITQIWHAGAGFKSTGYSRFGHTASPAPESGHRQYTYGIAGSRKIRHFFSEVWGINDSMVLPAGMPRLDEYLDPKYKAKTTEELLHKFPILSKRVILFAPTYRGENKKHAYYPYEMIDFDRLYEVLQKTNSVFIFKMHPFISEPVPIPKKYSDRMYDISSYPNINDLFYVTDLLITDYSSNIYEFSLMRKPMLFFAYDIDAYSNSRGFHRDYRSNVPGKITETFDEMCDAILNEDFEYEKVHEYVENNFEKTDSHACDRIIDWIIKGNLPQEYKDEIEQELKNVVINP